MRTPRPAQVTGKLHTLATLAGAGIISPQRPDRLVGAAIALIRWGATPAAGYKAAASRYPDDLALIDETGTLTFREIHERSNALAHALAGEGIEAGDRVAFMCRNLYGSTEVAWATIATPDDLRSAPGTAGKPPRGTVVRLFDADGNEVAQGETGRIFVGNELAFEGYTGGGNKDAIDGLLSSGDVGHFDDGGRLFVDGRDDDMIVSGGENVFPGEVEDLLSGHEAVVEAAVFGVEDEQFGQRLKAVIVTREGKDLS